MMEVGESSTNSPGQNLTHKKQAIDLEHNADIYSCVDTIEPCKCPTEEQNK
jgi:hypothetical protein